MLYINMPFIPAFTTGKQKTQISFFKKNMIIRIIKNLGEGRYVGDHTCHILFLWGEKERKLYKVMLDWKRESFPKQILKYAVQI